MLTCRWVCWHRARDSKGVCSQRRPCLCNGQVCSRLNHFFWSAEPCLANMAGISFVEHVTQLTLGVVCRRKERLDAAVCLTLSVFQMQHRLLLLVMKHQLPFGCLPDAQAGCAVARRLSLCLWAPATPNKLLKQRRLLPTHCGLFTQVKELGDKACSVVGDLCDDDSSKNAVKQAISQLGGLDILVNNGGVSTDSMHKGENGADVFHDALTLHVTSALTQ